MTPNEKDYLNSLSGEPDEPEAPAVDDDTFVILGVNAETWNALPPGARYHLVADTKTRTLRQEYEGEV
jgi:hypothetical protein